MSNAIRTVDFTVTETDISPAVPQWAGVQGEHRATQVRFKVADALADSGFSYRVEWVDGMQTFAVSDVLVKDTDGFVSFLLPASWTAAGGTAEVRLRACRDDSDTEKGQVFYSATGRLTFSPRDENLPSVVEAENRLYAVLDRTQRILEKVENRVKDEVLEETGCVRFGGQLAFAYGRFTARAGETVEITMPCTFTNVYFLQVTGDDILLSVITRTHNSFTVRAVTNIGDGYWFAVGTLQED